MRADEIVRNLADHPGTRLLRSGGDTFAVHDPDGDLPPERRMPWATVVTSDPRTPDGTPWDTASTLDRPGVYRLNLGLPRTAYRALVLDDADPSAFDVLFAHPDYGALGWVCVLNPDRAWPRVAELLDAAHAFAVRKHENARRRR